MKSGLFWRMFSAILAVVLVTVVLFSAILITIQRSGMQSSYEAEVLTQARQVAEYMQQLNELSFVRRDSTIRSLVNKKINDIYDNYHADIWLVSFSSGIVQYIEGSLNTSRDLTSEAVLEQMAVIQTGQEIRKDGLFPELGDQVVTLGVPWTYRDGRVVGAVLLHIPVDRLHVSLATVFPQAVIPACTSLLLGILLAFLVARGQTHPIRIIDNTVKEYSTGNFSSKIDLHCGGELEQLADSINRMATELSELEDSRRSFVANVSHELRSPMTSIKGYIQAIQDGTIPAEDQGKYLQVVLDETNRLTNLVRDLLDLSRLESGKFPMDIAPFDANEMMRRILIGFEQRIDEKHIDVRIEFADDPCRALGDVSRINQVVSNFIDNAVKFMTGEASVLTLRTVCRDRTVRFEVEDNGPGIDAADQPHITERFYKADKAHTAGMGTGLGLSICRNILAQHGSGIEIESVPGRTVFAFALPAAEPVQRMIAGDEMRKKDENPG